MPRHTIGIAVAALAAAGIVGGAAWLGAQTGTSEPSSPQQAGNGNTTATAPSTSERAEPSRSATGQGSAATQAARHWLDGRYTLRASDDAADAWIDRVAPVSTPDLKSTLEKQHRGGSGGRAWSDFVEQRCTRTVTGLGAEQVPEAPASKSSRWLRVSGTAVTSCETRPDEPPFPARQPVTATLQLVRQDDGSWLVAEHTRAG